MATLNKSVIMEAVGNSPLGGIAVKIYDRRRLYEPLYIVAVYVPPTTSTRAADREPLLAWAAATYKSLTDTGHSCTVMAGDFNTRPSALRGHHSEDASTAKSPAERAFAKRLRALAVSPVHGRCKTRPAGTTSRQVTLRDGEGTAEVDYVIAADDATFASPRKPLPWGPTGHGATHRAVSVRVTLPLRAPQTPAAARAPPPQQSTVARPPPYPDAEAYDRVARRLRAAARRTAPDLADIERALAGIARKYMPSKLPPRRRTAMRQYKGFPLPSALVARIAATRRAQRRLKAAASNPAARATKLAELERQHLRNKLASRRILRQRAAEVSNRMERARGLDAHNLHRQLNALFTEDPTLVGRDAHELKVETARAHWAESLRDTRPDVMRGATLPSALRDVPTAAEAPAATGLAAPPSDAPPLPAPGPVILTRACVRNAIWGPSARRPPLRCAGAAACTICDDVHGRWIAATRDPSVPMPTDGPHVRTSKSAGPCGIPAELLRFMRLQDDPAGTERIRNRVSQLIADALNRAIQTSSFPVSFTVTNLTPLLKSARVPHQDRANANNYRPVVTAAYLDKVLDAVLTRRLTHWVVRNRLIGCEQVGFMPGRSAEEHVATLREALNARHRAGTDTYVLFLDLKKAYDRVHIRTLARVLEHMGVPLGVTNLLVTLSSARQTRIKMNGELSEPFPATAGVPQGGIRSPILFDLFIESLSRHLKSLDGYDGVDVSGVNIRHLLYADDACALAASTEQIQVVAFAIAHWCTVWGMEANIGGGKTELLHVPRPGAPAAHQLRRPPAVWWPWEDTLTAIPWTTHYRYLGFPINVDLDNDAKTFSGAQRTALGKAMYRFYSHNPLRSYMSLRGQKHLFINTVTATTTYLRGVVLRDLAACAKIDAVAFKMGRQLLGGPRPLPKSASNLIVSLHTGIHLNYAQQAQMRTRVLNTARLSPDSLFQRLLMGLERGNKRDANIVNVARRQLAAEQRKFHAAPPPPPASTHDVAPHARTYGIRVALGMMAADVRHVQGAAFTARPRWTSVQAAVVDAAGGSLPPPATVPVTQHLPASLIGPGTRGSLLLIANVPAAVARALVANSLGPMSMSLSPWAPESADSGSDDEDADGNTPRDAWSGGPLSRRHRRAVRGAYGHWDKVCPICDAGHDDAYHAFFECPAARMRIARRRLFSSLKKPVRAIVAAGRRLAPDALRLHRQRIAALEHAVWDSADGRSAAFRLLCGFPFQARAVPEAEAPLSNALGTIFDALATDTRHLVGMARAIVTWATECTRRAAAARRNAIDDCGAGTTQRPPPAPPRDNAYPHGGTITALSHDTRTYTRWKLAHHQLCDVCGVQSEALQGCSHCDLAVHAPGSECTPGLTRLPAGAEWTCTACCIAIAPLAAALGDNAPVRIRARA